MKRGVRRQGRRRTTNVPEWASCSETTLYSNTFVSGQMYQAYNLNLSQCPRASAIAKNYQYYRIKSVQYTFKPLMDTFTAGGVTVPYLYYLIDKAANAAQATTAAELRSMGAKPLRFDDKTLNVRFSPAVLRFIADNIPAPGIPKPGEYKVSPWLATNDNNDINLPWAASQIDHLGLIFFVETTSGVIGVSLERTVEFEFKKALVTPLAAGLPPIQIDDDVVLTEAKPVEAQVAPGAVVA